MTRLPQDFEIARESRYDVVPIHCYMAIAIECNWFGCNVPSVCVALSSYPCKDKLLAL